MSDANSGGFNMNKLFSGGLGKVRYHSMRSPTRVYASGFPQFHFTCALNVYCRVDERQLGWQPLVLW
jgi:hypothetical protein